VIFATVRTETDNLLQRKADTKIISWNSLRYHNSLICY